MLKDRMEKVRRAINQFDSMMHAPLLGDNFRAMIYVAASSGMAAKTLIEGLIYSTMSAISQLPTDHTELRRLKELTLEDMKLPEFEEYVRMEMDRHLLVVPIRQEEIEANNEYLVRNANKSKKDIH